MSDHINDLLAFDPLSVAEKITGRSYKEDDETSRLGLGLAMRHNEIKAKTLEAADDSFFSMTLEQSVSLHERLGFDVVLCDEFMDDPEGKPETYRILWHSDGILATIESYGSTRVNVSKMYYNVEFRPEIESRFSYTSSGHMFGDRLWSGYHDTREGLRHAIEGFRSVGSFLNPWRDRPFLWLLTYMDTKDGGYDYEAIAEERIARLPEHVRGALA